MRHPQWALLAFLAVIGCGDGQGEPPPATSVRDSAGVRIVESARPRDGGSPWTVRPEPTVQIGAVEGTKEQQLFQVADAARLSDGGWAVLDGGSRELRLYDPQGRPVASVGGSGEGPGEFRYPTRLHVMAGDTLLVWDASTRRVSYFASSGAFIRSESRNYLEIPGLIEPPLFPEYGDLVPDGSLLILLYERGSSESLPAAVFRPRMLYVWAHMDARVDTLGWYGGVEQQLIPVGSRRYPAIPPFAKDAVAAFGGTPLSIYVGNQESPQIERFEAGGLRSLVRWRAEPKRVTDGEVAAWRARVREWMERHGDGGAIERVLSRATMPRFRKPYGDIHVDEEGNLWVESSEALGNQGGPYEVFSPQGVWITEVELPALKVFEIGHDYIVGLYRDETDVEFVRVHELSRAK